MSASLEIQLIALFTAAACSLCGSFLVLRKSAMESDAITHTILLGIVLAFFVTGDLSSPLLLMGATLMGVATVWLTGGLTRSRLVSEDAAIGMLFPLFFALAILLISRYADSVHLDTDAVLLGELAFAPFDRLVIGGVDWGAKSLYLSGGLLLLNGLFIGLFYKELKLSSFDPVLAQVMGYRPGALHYGLMTLVSLTAVAAFESVGSVLVVAFMIGPPVTAYLLTWDVKWMLALSLVFGGLSGVLGYQSALWLDVSIPGAMAVVTGLLFFLVFACSPKRQRGEKK